MNQKAELDKQMLAVELDLLKSKLNPHFLFNTLNNIDSLIHQNPAGASEALIRLSDIMRYLTYETTSELVELSREIEYIRNLIELYRIRIKTPEDIRFDAHGNFKIMIAPAIFVPLIENAFKYASYRNCRPCVDINLKSEDGIIDFEISNYYEISHEITGKSHSGYGIMNLKKRLELTYPGRHQLTIEPGPSYYMVKLKINTHAD
jgi:two-component system, LytTR family, sensor kinase